MEKARKHAAYLRHKLWKEIFLEMEMAIADVLLHTRTQQAIHYRAGVLEGVQWARDVYMGSNPDEGDEMEVMRP